MPSPQTIKIPLGLWCPEAFSDYQNRNPCLAYAIPHPFPFLCPVCASQLNRKSLQEHGSDPHCLDLDPGFPEN